MSKAGGDSSVIRIAPYSFIHVLDNNSNVTRVVVGPHTFTRQEHETLVLGPEPMIMIPPRHYCIIQNPTVVAAGQVAKDASGQVKLRHGDEEVRFSQDPFPLYPGEKLYGKVSPLQVVAPNTALRLRAIRDVKDEDETIHNAGDEWLFKGPGTYVPRVEVQVAEIVRAIIIKPNQAIRLRARKQFKDERGVVRKAGEEWLVRDSGAYLPAVEEEVVETVSAFVLTDKKALQLEALNSFTDVFGRARKAGDTWLVTIKEAETHIPDVYEKVIGEVKLTTLTSRQYCVVLDPSGANGKPSLGKRELRKGELSFFLQPGERLESGVQPVHVLDSEEALLLRAKEGFKDGKDSRAPGDRWVRMFLFLSLFVSNLVNLFRWSTDLLTIFLLLKLRSWKSAAPFLSMKTRESMFATLRLVAFVPLLENPTCSSPTRNCSCSFFFLLSVKRSFANLCFSLGGRRN